MLKPDVKTSRRWIGRVLVPLAIVLFAALMCAGPGAVVAPGTMQLTSPLVCPSGSSLQQIEQPGNDNGESVVYVTLKCVGADASSPASVTAVFGVLAIIYFVIFGIAALIAIAALKRRVNSPGPIMALPLGADELSQVRARLAAGQKIEAIRLVQQLTGAGLAEAKRQVEALAPDTPPQP